MSRSPLPPNRACGSPAHGSPVGGSPQRGLTGRCVGCDKREQPTLGKEGIRPALMVPATTAATSMATATENTAQTHPYPTIRHLERERGAVLEVFKPAFRRPVDVRDDRSKAMPVITPCLGTDRIAELTEALSARPVVGR